MPSYAVLGATGNTGQSLLNVLSQSPDNEIHAYVRSKSKMLRLSPELSAAQNVRIFEGDLDDVSLISECISGTTAVFMAVAVSDNVPGCTIAQDTAHVVVAAMEKLRSRDPDVKLPRIIVLSSASLDDYLCRDLPHFVHWMLFTCCSNVYADLIKAEQYLRSQESWITSTFIKPGGLVHDDQKGHMLSTETQQTFLSFLDLAAGMVEVADTEGDKWDMKNVSVLPTAKDVKFEWMAPINLVKGLLCHFFSSAYLFLKS
jgi:putative NADH-flavin reductase